VADLNILVIKQTSLGDVLHSTGHIRTVRENFPSATICLLTASSSVDLYRNCPYLDDMIVFDRYGVKRRWLKEPLWALNHIRDVLRQIRRRQFDLAIDLQGASKSALFMYLGGAKRKFIKGIWLGIPGVRDTTTHAIKEMDAVLALAGLKVVDTRMEMFITEPQRRRVRSLLDAVNPRRLPVVVISPYSRWTIKDWPDDRYAELAVGLAANCLVLITGADDRQGDIQRLVSLAATERVRALPEKLGIGEFAALVSNSVLLVSGDSFPMHLASAMAIPQVAVFGPTDERRVGPVGTHAVVIKPDDAHCQRCAKPRSCRQRCIDSIAVEQVLTQSKSLLRRCSDGG
jgi:heptosyltransferase-2